MGQTYHTIHTKLHSSLLSAWIVFFSWVDDGSNFKSGPTGFKEEKVEVQTTPSIEGWEWLIVFLLKFGGDGPVLKKGALKNSQKIETGKMVIGNIKVVGVRGECLEGDWRS